MEQITNKVIMIRPANFKFNEETAENNAFQTKDIGLSSKEVAVKAVKEFDNFVSILLDNGIEVEVIQDTDKPIKPDAIFPNNWFSMHQDGTIITYPMHAEIRRPERREDIVEMLIAKVKSPRRYGFEYFEEDGKFLEGTGSMILDRANDIIYACLSPRTHVKVLEKYSVLRNYSKIFFTALDRSGLEIYHTNVMVAVGEHFALICLESVKNEVEKKQLLDSFEKYGKEIIDINYDQLESFAGNMLQLKNTKGDRFIVMSQNARKSLKKDQITALEKHGKILSPDITTIETIGGGSARCMIAENFLPYN